MGWEHHKKDVSVWHDHTLHKYKKPRIYMPDFVSRTQWGAEEPWKAGEPVVHPVNKINFAYTETEICNTVEDCSRIVQNIQKEHIVMGMSDIAFNFLIGGDGRKYEGRGWNVRAEQPGRSVQEERNTIDIAFIGNAYTYKREPTPIMNEARGDLINFGVSNKYISCCYHVDHEIFERGAQFRM